jgi:protocatechuate 3,4-dioxygenase beta subunit
MTSQLELDLQASFDRRRVLGGMALGLGGLVIAACGSRAGAQPSAAACIATPRETRGPFPADGSNGQPPINVLAEDGIIRRDIRPSFAGMAGRAEGVPLELELTLVGGSECMALANRAIYLWQNDAAGIYSLYNDPAVNYLRGLQPADASGKVRFTAIVPGCYGGRYPHCHFEVFESVAAAVGGARPLLVSQLAFPAEECGTIYRTDERYGDSQRNLDRLPIDRDFVFGDAAANGQIVAMSGSPATGYRGTARVVLNTRSVRVLATIAS